SYPNSSGSSLPRFRPPEGACDCHLHIYDPRFPMAWPELRPTPDATVADYRLLQQRLGTTRAVVVQPAAYGIDNRVTLDALAQMGPAARGVAVVEPSVSDEELAAMHEAGVRGVRFSLYDRTAAVISAEMIEPLAPRIAAMGWHVQLHLRGDQIVAMADLLGRLPGTVVVDHMGRMPQPEGIRHPAFAVVRRLLDTGRAWVKLSAPYLESKTGSPHYSDATRVAREYVRHAPQRLVWGSDWPHPTERDKKPDDAALLDLLHEWALDDELFRRILADNPAALYGF
ncbi:MAG TPA: amidohydrolase family protein, partial [Gemmatimonadales bacterium]|nr:amidohydrolase family protein [Gemmatimonadales bacterium]